VEHTGHALCESIYAAAEQIFKKCGKPFQKTYSSDIVSSAEMKKWLEEIRQHARSKWLVIFLYIFDFAAINSALEGEYIISELVN